MHWALQTCKHSPHLRQRAGLNSNRQRARRANQPSNVPTGQMVLQYSRPRAAARPRMAAVIASTTAVAAPQCHNDSTRYQWPQPTACASGVSSLPTQTTIGRNSCMPNRPNKLYGSSHASVTPPVNTAPTAQIQKTPQRSFRASGT
jgi:hypothetical protein